MTLGAVCHFYNESRGTLEGLIKQAPETFDHIAYISTPPEGKTDEASCQLVLDAGYPLLHNTVSQGYGVLRSWCISQSPCDWVMILDSDERVFANAPRLNVSGTEKWPQHKNPNVQSTETGDTIDQKALLHQLIAKAENEGCLAICLSRRHWMGPPGEWTHPCQDWQHVEHDWQLRLVKNSPYLCYDPEVRMHERLVDTRTWESPKYLHGSLSDGPFYDHFSIWAKALDPKKNKEDAETYESLQPGCVKDMWLSHQPFPK